jgi:hypothetical protein
MIVVVLTGLCSLGLFGLAGMFAVRAGGKPPLAIRTESRRSQEEYDFNRAAASLRRRGYACLMAGALLLVVCLALSVLTTLSDS